MVVNEILVMAAQELGIGSEVQEYLGGVYSAVGERETELLLAAYNVVENELALDYFPIVREQAYLSLDGKVPYSELERDPVRIVAVYHAITGEEVGFTVYADHLVAEARNVIVRYYYMPETKGTGEECEIGYKVSKHLLVYGVAEHYSMAMGEFEHASVWERKYKEAIVKKYEADTSKRIASRSWV